MKQLIPKLPLVLCTALLFLFVSCIDEEEDIDTGTVELKVGDKLPDFEVTMNDSSIFSKNDLKGQCGVTVLFHTQCPDCQEEFPILQRLYEECPYPFKMVCISRKETDSSIQKYWKEHGLTLPYSAQSNAEIYHRFASSIIPRIYISDQECTIKAIYTDHPIATYEELLADIKKITQH